MPASTSIARSRALAHCSFARPRPLLVRAPTSVARSRAHVHCSFARVRPPKALFVSSSQSHSYRTMPRSGPCAHAGFVVKVERDTERYFKDSEFEAYAAPAPPHLAPPPFRTRVRFPTWSSVGAQLVEHGGWKTAPADNFIVGLKELPENDTSPLRHRHIFFGHCFKGQFGWKELLNRFVDGGGALLDMEFLNDEKGMAT